MKKKCNNIFVLFLATIIFFVGAGVTVLDLCCSKCVDSVLSMDLDIDKCSIEKTEIGSLSSCCTDPTALTDQFEDDLCMTTHTDKCCEAKRVSIDLDRSVFPSSLLSSMIWTLVPSFFCDIYVTFDSNELLIAGEATDPILIPPRNYLSLIRVLII